jgi:hypothetical protein
MGENQKEIHPNWKGRNGNSPHRMEDNRSQKSRRHRHPLHNGGNNSKKTETSRNQKRPRIKKKAKRIKSKMGITANSATQGKEVQPKGEGNGGTTTL